MKTVNLRKVDIRRYDVSTTYNYRLIQGEFEHNQISGKITLKFWHCGFLLRLPITATEWLQFKSPDSIIRENVKTRMQTQVAQFFMRAEATARGGYD